MFRFATRFFLGPVLFLLLFVALYQGLQAFWRVVYPERVFVHTGESFPFPKQTKLGDNKATQWDWFIAQDVSRPAPKNTKINARLLGIIGYKGEGVAIMKVDGKGSKAYLVGSKIKEGYLLESIGQAHIVMLHGDTEEILNISRSKNVFAGGGLKEPLATPLERAVGRKLTYAVPQDSKHPISHGKVDAFKRKVREDPLSLMQHLNVQVVSVPGRGRGFKIFPKSEKDTALLEALGLNKGDVILTINGTPVQALGQDASSLRRVLDEGFIDVRIVRSHAERNVEVNLF